MALKAFYQKGFTEAGCDEAGRGCLAGPVFAAAVILPHHFQHPLLADSKQLSEAARCRLRPIIEQQAVAFAVASCCNGQIDAINILQASVQSMHEALKKLAVQPQHILVDGNYFKSYNNLPHFCIVRGDGLYASIAAASVLAKTYRDDYMRQLHQEYPQYGWARNKGYGTREHQQALNKYGPTPYHRRSFRLEYCI